MHRVFLIVYLLLLLFTVPLLAQGGDDQLPSFIDNSTSKYFPPVISQQGGSCAQAAGVGYMFTYEMNRYLNQDASLDENRFSYLYTWNYVNGGKDEGGFVTLGLNILMNYGAMSLIDYGTSVSTYSYQWASGYEKYLRSIHKRVKEIQTFTVTNDQEIEDVKQYLYDKGDGLVGGGVLTSSLYSSGWGIDNNYSGPSNTGYTSILNSLASNGAHAVTIVGYDDAVVCYNAAGEQHIGAFIVVNSWGSYMHDNGRFYLPYFQFTERADGLSESVLSSTMSAISVTTYQPKVVMKVDMSYSSRDDIAVQYGVNDNYTSTIPIEKHPLSIIYNQGGDHPMQGEYASNGDAMEFAIDFTSTVSESGHPAKYFFNIVRSVRGSESGDGYVKSLTLYDYRADQDNPITYTLNNQDNQTLKIGENYFMIMPREVSASIYQYLDLNINNYLVRGADGKYSKVEVDPTDHKKGTIKLRYTYNLDK